MILFLIFFLLLSLFYGLIFFQNTFIYPGSSAPLKQSLTENIEELSVPNVRHRTFWVPGKADQKEILLFCSGNAMNASHSIAFSHFINHESVVGILLPEYPGYGESLGVTNRSTIIRAVCASVSHALSQHPGARIHGVGYSLGCAVVLEVAARMPEVFSNVSLIAPFSKIQTVVEDVLPLGVGKVLSGFVHDRWDNVTLLKGLLELRRFQVEKVKLFHARDDHVVLFYHSEILKNINPDRVVLEEIPRGTGGHLVGFHLPWFQKVTTHAK